MNFHAVVKSLGLLLVAAIPPTAIGAAESNSQVATNSALPSPAEISAARNVLEQELVDYPNARFQSVTAHRYQDTGTLVFCGRVNSPNRMGGMTGWLHFAILPTFPFPYRVKSTPPSYCDQPRLDEKDYSEALARR